MRRRRAELGLLAAALSAAATAADGDGPWSFSGRAGVVSDYIARGLSQTWGRPALQAELEAEHESGFYAGAFTSNVSDKLYPGGRYELQMWSGYEHELGNAWALFGEAVYYVYPGANYRKGNCTLIGCRDQRFDTLLARIGASRGVVSTRFAYALTDYFGENTRTGFTGSTRGSWYWELNGDYALPRSPHTHVVAHVGYSYYRVRFAFPDPRVLEDPRYWDFKLGLTYDLGKSWRLSVYHTRVTNRSFHEARSLTTGEERDLGNPAFVVGLDWKF